MCVCVFGCREIGGGGEIVSKLVCSIDFVCRSLSICGNRNAMTGMLHAVGTGELLMKKCIDRRQLTPSRLSLLLLGYEAVFERRNDKRIVQLRMNSAVATETAGSFTKTTAAR